MNTIRKYKLTAYSTGLTLGEGSYHSSADAWSELGKMAKKNNIAILWVYLSQEPIFINEVEVNKAYVKEFGDLQHGIPPIKYWSPFLVGLAGDNYPAKKEISIDFPDQSIKIGSGPNSFIHIPDNKRK